MTDREWRQHFLSVVMERIKEKFGEWPSFNVQELAIQLQGASFLSGKFRGSGSEAYMIVAWDILGCLEDRGEVIKVRENPTPSPARPWMFSDSWKVGPEADKRGGGWR